MNPETNEYEYPVIPEKNSEDLHKVMHEKKEQGDAILTTVHHRETPERLL